MSIPYARLGIPASLRRSVEPGAPRTAKLAVAKGLLPTTADVQLALLYVLAVDSDTVVAELARETLAGLPEDQILGGLTQRTFPKIIEFIAEFRTNSQMLDDRIIHIRETTTRTAVQIAGRAGSDLCEVICRHQERLLLSPEVFVALYANPNCLDDDLGRAEAFLRMHRSLPEVPEQRPFRVEPETVEQAPEEPAPEPAAAASPLTPPTVHPSTEPAAQPSPTPADHPSAAPAAQLQAPQQPAEKLQMFNLQGSVADDNAFEAFKFDFHDDLASFSWDLTKDEDEDDNAEEELEQYRSIEQRIAEMSVGEKIKMAYLGNKSARNILIRDPNKIVCTAVVKSGRLSPSEVATYAGNRNLTEDVAREICRNKVLTRKYPVKVALVNNPKTPVRVALKFIVHLHKRDLKALSNNRNVTAVIFQAAKKLFKSKYQR
jgi:hypothetical protein